MNGFLEFVDPSFADRLAAFAVLGREESQDEDEDDEEEDDEEAEDDSNTEGYSE
jgi:hypothetical protein